MSITYASGRGIESKYIPNTYAKVVSSSPTTYVRPSDWLTLPTIESTDQKSVILCAIYETGKNIVALSATVSAGTYTIDWGDGTSPQTYSGGTVATYSYDYSTISNSTISTRGYKQVIITITPTTANLLTVNFIPVIPALPQYGWSGGSTVSNRPFLDIALGSPNLTNFTLGGNLYVNLLEQFSLISVSSAFVDMNSKLSQLTSLKSVPVFNCAPQVNNFTYLFSGSTSLLSGPPISVNPTAGINCLAMFQGCASLNYVPDYEFKITNAGTMFSTCYSLVKAPNLNLSICTSTSSMFSTCYALVEVPAYNTTSLLTSTATMFFNCYSLVNVPFFVTNNVTSANGMFNGCKSLVNVPLYNLGNSTVFSSLFANCHSLTNVPIFDTSKGTDFNSMFQYCYSLKEVPSLNTSNATSMATMFGQCFSLETIPLIDTSKVTTTAQMFYQDYSLESIPLINTSNVTTMHQMFYQCSSLTTIPELNTINVANMAGTFTLCGGLTSFPALNTSNVTTLNLTWYQCSALPSLNTFDSSNCLNFQGTFANMQSLREIPPINTSKGTNFTSFAIGCTALQKFPLLNVSNGTASGSQFANTCSSLQSIPAMDVGKMITLFDVSGCTNLTDLQVMNLSYATTIANCKLDTTAIETVFNNINPAVGRTITITTNPGADTPIAKIGTWTANTKSITVNNNTGLVVGMYVTGSTLSGSTSASFNSTTNIVAVPSPLSLANDSIVRFVDSVNGLTAYRNYYVINSSGQTFQVSLTQGGAAVDITGTTGTLVRWGFKIASIVGTTVTMDNPSVNAGTSIGVNFRYLNTYLATGRNWVVTG